MLNQQEMERLHQALNPDSVAVIGATKERDRVGYSILESILLGGFEGRVYPIHPRHEEILGLKVYSSLAEVKAPIDLAIIALNEHKTIEAIKDCGNCGVKGAICVAGGFSEVGEQGKKLQMEMAKVAREYKVHLIGPNTLGVLNTEKKLNATFWPIELKGGGRVSLVTQSGGVGQMVGFQMFREGLPVNKMIGLGNRAMLDFDDLVQYLGRDDSTSVIGVFLEGTEKARQFIETARVVVPNKPVVVLKVGRSKLVQEISVTHTGSMAGSYRVYRDIFKQARILPAESVPELVSICKALAIAPLPGGNGVSIVTPTAGPSLMLADQLDGKGGVFNPFSPGTWERMTALFVNVPVVLKNPLDAASAGYSADTYVSLLDIVLADPGVDLLVAITIEHKNRVFPAEALIELKNKHKKPILVYYMGNEKADHFRTLCQAGGIPFYGSIEETAWGVNGLVRYAQIRKQMSTGRDETIH